MKHIPIVVKRGPKRGIVAAAQVDDELFAELSRYEWHPGPTPSTPPRTWIRTVHPPLEVYLHRLVFVLSCTDAAQRATLRDPQALYDRMSLTQHIKLIDTNPLNCQLDNLDATLSQRSKPSIKRRVEAAAEASLLTDEQVQREVEELERLMGGRPPAAQQELAAQQGLGQAFATPLDYDPLEDLSVNPSSSQETVDDVLSKAFASSPDTSPVIISQASQPQASLVHIPAPPPYPSSMRQSGAPIPRLARQTVRGVMWQKPPSRKSLWHKHLQQF